MTKHDDAPKRDGSAAEAVKGEAAKPEPRERTLDARSLRGLAHPLRIRLLGSLRHDGPATASQLGERLGESSGATSYHLRQLAAHGFVEDAPEHGKGRERWWRATHDGTSFSEELHNNPDPEVRGAVDLFKHEIATIHTQELSTWLGTMNEWADEWATNADMSDFTLRLTAAQLRELNEKTHELIESYRGLAHSDAEDTAQVRVHLHSFPRKSH
ncbi:winged helix-turn-helix domain-containing protein [Streptomyces sp. NPDC023838]|uniref:ArsR/SmtB family transcription factor n=1 Tax=Streptomyces sp. NPDC023838 TaxID=3154325 RepID=UPI0033E32E68